MPDPLTQGLKKLAARLPSQWQQELKRRHFARQIRANTFRTDEPEYPLLAQMLSPGDWVLDIGANIGHYTLRLSELVGAEGRVISFEPVPETFELLAANAALSRFRNISLVNAAVSDASGISGMSIPKSGDTGLENFYMAQLTGAPAGNGLRVLCVPLDAFQLPHAIRLVKIDAEGHELSVLRGMRTVLERDHPTMIVEDGTAGVEEFLSALGYSAEKLPGSSNRIFRTSPRQP